MRSEDHFLALKACLLEEGGYDRLVEFFGMAHMNALMERANAINAERMKPDYAACVPHDLQARVAIGLGAKVNG